MDQNETTPSVKCWTAFRHPPSQDLVLGRIRSPSYALRWTDWAHLPSRFGLVPILNKAAPKVLDGSTLPPFGVEIGFKNGRGSCATCWTPPENSPAWNAASLQFGSTLLLCDSLDRIFLPSFGPYPPSLICRIRVHGFRHLHGPWHPNGSRPMQSARADHT